MTTGVTTVSKKKINHDTITARQEWVDFETKCLQGCSDLQKDEMRKAFYAGIVSASNIMASIPDHYTEAQHMAVFDRVFMEAERILVISEN